MKNPAGLTVNKIDPRKRKNADAQAQLGGLLFAATEGDTHALKAAVEAGCDLNISDYDARTALHLAASEG
jgi:glutaminase